MDSVHKNFVLKVNINCCEECPKKLEKALLRLTGISSMAINVEENLVSVSGIVDSNDLKKAIYMKIGKMAKIIFCDAKSTKEANTKPHSTKPKSTESNSQHKGKMHKTSCCGAGNCPKREKDAHKCEVYEGPPKIQGNYHKMEKDEHECEPYEGPPKVQDFVCRDYFCKIHPRNRKITDKVPASESNMSMFGHFPNYGYYGGGNSWYPVRNACYPKWR